MSTNFPPKIYPTSAQSNLIQGKSVSFAETFASILPNTGYINTSGAVVVDSNWKYSEYLEVASYDFTDLSVVGTTTVSSIAYYDTNKAWISSVVSSTALTLFNPGIIPPSTAKFIRISAAALTYQTQISLLQRINVAYNTRTPDYFRFEVAGFAVNNGYIGSSGETIADTNWLNSDFIECNIGDEFSYRVRSHSGNRHIAFYTKEKVFISGIAGSVGVEVAGATTAPADTAFYRVSFAKPGGSDAPSGYIQSVKIKVLGPNTYDRIVNPKSTAFNPVASTVDAQVEDDFRIGTTRTPSFVSITPFNERVALCGPNPDTLYFGFNFGADMLWGDGYLNYGNRTKIKYFQMFCAGGYDVYCGGSPSHLITIYGMISVSLDTNDSTVAGFLNAMYRDRLSYPDNGYFEAFYSSEFTDSATATAYAYFVSRGWTFIKM